MRLIMFGTGPFAAPTFRALLAGSYDVAALVTQPPREVRGKSPVGPMRQVALEHGTPVLDPASVNAPDAQAALRALAAELFVVADYGQILADETLAIAPRGGINLHGSLLPKYRGAAPINWAIYRGEATAGVTVIGMTPRVDAGPCFAQASTPIGPDESAVELEQRLAELGAPLVCRTIDELAAGKAQSIPQDPAQATPARRLRKTDGAIDWSRSARAIKDQIRALEPWPRTYTYWHRPGHAPLRLILGQVSAIDGPAATPGEVVTAARDELKIATGDGLLSIHTIQPAGKQMLSIAEFLRGYPVKPGERLGPEAEA